MIVIFHVIIPDRSEGHISQAFLHEPRLPVLFIQAIELPRSRVAPLVTRALSKMDQRRLPSSKLFKATSSVLPGLLPWTGDPLFQT
ncbi:hypothetical protein CC2G_010544 [Coprinopsis cinerea AmutBmut pab1-1]|nr:hypothetical protein CC2G_010544 [Coprinopsis cinerea AmutBmut pab1-1]